MADLITLEIHGGVPTTTSLAIAERFGKLHKNVLRAIETLECSERFQRLNFEPVTYKGGNGELRPMYAITKNGFAFLVMGFTGKEAAAWKERYIEAFDAMADKLRLQNTAPLMRVMDLNRQCKRLINQSAWRMGGRDNFERCRAQLIEQVQLAATSGRALSERWFEEVVQSQSSKYHQLSG